MAEITPTLRISPEFLKILKVNFFTYMRALPPASHTRREINRVSTKVYFNELKRDLMTENSFGAYLSLRRSRVHRDSVLRAWLNVISKYICKITCFKQRKFRYRYITASCKNGESDFEPRWFKKTISRFKITTV